MERMFTINAEELQARPFVPPTFLVEGLIPQGVSLLCGPSKCGKSWLVLWMAMRICQGLPIWGLKTHPCEVLYLCLEDTFSRLQDRMYRLPDEAPSGLHLCAAAGKLRAGLEEQIESHMAAHPETELIIIDTFQKIRTAHGSGVGVYAGDYEDVSTLKKIADGFGISILLVHHLRKQKDKSDPFNQISGSNGILGAADAAFVMVKERRSQGTVSMFMTGRDLPYQELVLQLTDCVWELLEQKTEDDIRAEEIPEFVYRLKVKGGLTGPAQVFGRYNTDALNKLKMDLEYITHCSVLLDLQILFETVKILVQKESTEGFSEKKQEEMRIE